PLAVSFRLEGNLSRSVELDKNEATIEPKSATTLTVSMYGREEGQFDGSVLILSNIEQRIPISLEVSETTTSAVGALMIELKLLQEKAISGKELNYVIDILNVVADDEFDIELVHTIERLSSDDEDEEAEEGEEVLKSNNWSTSEVFPLKHPDSLLRKFKVPEDFDIGDYSITIEATYLNYTSIVRGLFIVERPFHKKELGGAVPIWVLASVIFSLTFSYASYVFIKKQKEKNKRFHASVDYKALPKEGDRSLFCGLIAETKHKFYMDMDRLTVHSIVAGSTGGGKSIAAQDIIEECLLKGTAVAVFDPTAQWSGMLRKLTDKKFLSFYPPFGLNPKKDPTAFPGNIKAIKDHREVVDIFKYMKPGEIQVFTTNTLDPKNYDTFVANMIRQIFHSKLDEFRQLKFMVVFDEIHRILPKFGGSGEGFTQIERGCREFRKWGIGILLISQVLSDFVGEIKANINTLVQMKTRDEGDLNRIKMQYGEEFIQSLVKSPVGSGMVQNSSYNKGQPFYVTFRPILHSVARLKDDELEEYNKYNDIIEDIEYQFQQLEELKQDVFDLKLELKLSKDKVKAGNFNMVKIYLDGLTPRIQKIWDKLGKKPKKLEVKLVSEDDLKAELEAAKAAKEKADAESKANEKPEEKKEEKEEEVQMTPEQIAENTKAVEKLFSDIEESFKSKDYFAINDRIIELQSMPIPKDKKAEVTKKIEDVKKKLEEAKKGGNNG
ncbi:ATP-binding protein, partial [Nanoarchaeota archaeon]